MSEQRILDHTRFEDLASSVVSSMRRNVTTAERVVDEKNGAKGLQLVVADGRRGDPEAPTIIVPRAYQAFERDGFEDQRDKVLASVLGARVIGIDTPGVSLYTDSRASAKQRMEAIRGRMKHQAFSQLTAALDTIDYKGERLDFLGYSMGAWAVAEMVKLPMPIRVGRIDMVEAVNDQKWRLFGKNGLMSKIVGEDKATNRYLSQNVPYHFKQPFDRDYPDYAKINPDSTLPQRSQSLLLGFGMRKSFAPTLLAALEADKGEQVKGLSDAPIHFWRTNGSGVARQAAHEATIEELTQYTSEARLTTLTHPRGDEPHRHPFWHSMPAVAIWALMRQTTINQ